MAALLLLGGCYRNTIITGAPEGEIHLKSAQFFVWGLVNEPTFRLDEICPEGVSKVQEYMNPLQCVAAGCTAGLFIPVTVRITCADGVAWNASPDPENGVTWLTPVEG